ncbi:MAG: reverse transcriptase family protein [Pseudomonadota bacterium]
MTARPPIPRALVARRIAGVLLGGGWDEEQLAARLKDWLGSKRARAPQRLAGELIAAWQAPYPPSPAVLTRLVEESPNFAVILSGLRRRRAVLPSPDLSPPIWQPTPTLAGLGLEPLATPLDLAQWLGLSLTELDWFSDPQNRLARPAALGRRHYEARWVPKRAGGHRLIEAPLPRLKAIQRRVLHEILEVVPPHPAARGFRRGEDVRRHAALHVGEETVITADFAAFYPSVPHARVHRIFRSLGYPWAVARLLAGLTTTRSPSDVLAAPQGAALPWQERRQLAEPHLPQGAPTSPALANLACFALDRRLQALIHRMGGQYSRYADDLAFSGPRRIFPNDARGFLDILEGIVSDEGFRLNRQKTRVMRAGTCQRVTGMVVNAHINTARREFETLKAILTNCQRSGPASQNRSGHPAFRQHLEGRVSWHASVNPARGRRLYRLLDAIDWDGSAGEDR